MTACQVQDLLSENVMSFIQAKFKLERTVLVHIQAHPCTYPPTPTPIQIPSYLLRSTNVNVTLLQKNYIRYTRHETTQEKTKNNKHEYVN